MALAEDASAPAIQTVTGVGSINTTTFSPPASSFVVAFVCAPWATTGNTIAITFSDSGSHTWANPVLEASNHSSGNNAGGTIGIYTAYFATAPGSISLSASFTNQGGGSLLATKVFTGANSNQTGAATAKTDNGNPTNSTTSTTSITTTQTGSAVYGVTSDGNGNTSQTFTANGSTTSLDYWNSDMVDLIYVDFFKATSNTATPGPTTLGGTWGIATQSPIAMLEILPAAAGSPSYQNESFMAFF